MPTRSARSVDEKETERLGGRLRNLIFFLSSRDREDREDRDIEELDENIPDVSQSSSFTKVNH